MYRIDPNNPKPKGRNVILSDKDWERFHSLRVKFIDTEENHLSKSVTLLRHLVDLGLQCYEKNGEIK